MIQTLRRGMALRGRGPLLSARRTTATPLNPGNPTIYTSRTSTTWTAPATVTQVDALLVGAAGGPGWRTQGGAGAYMHVEGLPIVGGQTYTLTPGTGGQRGGSGGTWLGGEPGGGDGGHGGTFNGGGGGGFSVILDPDGDPMAVAGAGGGGATTDAGEAVNRYGSGGAGGESGGAGNDADATPNAYGGGGATPDVAGVGGTGAAGSDGSDGSDLQGGDGGTSIGNEGGGGGGGGFKGGGGGEGGSNGAGGGGGSSALIAPGTATFSAGVGARPVPLVTDLLAGHSTNPDYSPTNTLSLLAGQSGAIRLHYHQVGDALPEWLLDDGILSFVWAPWEVNTPELLAPMSQNEALGHGDRSPYCTDWKGALHGHNSTVSGQPLIDYGGSSAAPDAEGWFEFSGAQRWQFSAGNAALPAGLRYFAVVEWTSGSSVTLLELGNSSSSQDAVVIGLESGSISTAVRQRRGGSNLDLQAQVSPVPTGMTTVEVVTAPTSAGWVFEVNGADETSVGPSGSVADRHAVGPLYYGARYNSTNPFNGYIKGWVIASADVDEAVWAAATGWMSS